MIAINKLKKLSFFIGFVGTLLLILCIGIAQAQSAVELRQEYQQRVAADDATPRMSDMEPDINRGGLDYTNFDLESPDPALCLNACANDPTCKAWTYVRPNTTQGPNPRCWLKYAIPAPSQHSCCVSGIKLSSLVQVFTDDEYRHSLTVPLHTDRIEMVG